MRFPLSDAELSPRHWLLSADADSEFSAYRSSRDSSAHGEGVGGSVSCWYPFL